MGDKDEEGGEDASGSVTRYPVMPSLVALQLMRNRLHLAKTGKKLMKWTALATGRELRKLAKETTETYDSFRDDMRSCFMLLARARYFNPYVNDIILNNMSDVASIRVDKSFKSISGVKLLQLKIIDSGLDSYAHLGIGRGGTIVLEAKKAWRELLKRVIFMAQEREDFMELEAAHKNATKRQNVVSKVVIPRLTLTIRYILSELEEKEREDTFRLKRFKELKTKKANKNKAPVLTKISCECIGTCNFPPDDGPCTGLGKLLEKEETSNRKSQTKLNDRPNEVNDLRPKVTIHRSLVKETPKAVTEVFPASKSQTTESQCKITDHTPLCGSCKKILTADESKVSSTKSLEKGKELTDACTSCSIIQPESNENISSPNGCQSCPDLCGLVGEEKSRLVFASAQPCGCQSIKIVPDMKCNWFDDIIKVKKPGKLALDASILENIKSIFLLPPTSKKSCTKSVCSKQSSTCEADTNSDNEIEINKCKSCGTLTASIRSCRSVSSRPKVRKHKCDLGIEPTESKNKSSSACCSLSAEGSDNTDDPPCCLSSKDAASNTKKQSNVREVKSTPISGKKKITIKCSCKSDSTMNRDKKW